MSGAPCVDRKLPLLFPFLQLMRDMICVHLGLRSHCEFRLALRQKPQLMPWIYSDRVRVMVIHNEALLSFESSPFTALFAHFPTLLYLSDLKGYGL